MRTWGRQRGQTLIEYALLIVLISVVGLAVLTALGRKTRDVWVTVNSSLVTTSAAAEAAPPPAPAPWWQPYLWGQYGGYKADGENDQEAFNHAMGDLAGQFPSHPGDMPSFGEAGGWLGGKINGP